MKTQLDKTTQDQLNAWLFLNAWLNNSSPDATNEACLLGYAGTGKTWLVCEWLNTVVTDSALNVCIAAPTHKALDVLRSKMPHSVPVVFKTLHSLLGMMVAQQDDLTTETSISERDEKYDLVCVDEGSMENAEFYKLLIDNTGPGKRFGKVLHIGDPAQLPPVKEDLSPIFKIPHTVTLKQVVRYDSAILNVATMLRGHIESGSMFTLLDIVDVLKETPNDRSVSIIPRAKLYEWAHVAHTKKLDCRIIAWTNSAVFNHNKRMHEICFPGADHFAVGESILINDSYVLTKEQGSKHQQKQPPDSLYNGEVLTTISSEVAEAVAGVPTFYVLAERNDGQSVRLRFAPNPALQLSVHKALNEQIFATGRKRYDSPAAMRGYTELVAVRRTIARLAPLRHAYSNTVHKSQGSTYDISMVDFGDIYCSDDRARLMYVAATRPSMFLVLGR